jgi:hypothetical protein
VYSRGLWPDVAPADPTMSTQSPPSKPPSSLLPPPDSGSGKYLVVILLLGGGMAGLFFWRRSQADATQPLPSPSASAAIEAARAPHVDPIDIPPPPPPPPDASPEKVPPKVTSGGGGGDGCGQTTCNGSASADLQSALAFRAKTAHKCYDEALSQDSTLKGQVVISVRVSGNGTVCASSVVSSDIPNPSVAACIANRFRQGARLPSPTGGCVEVNVPMKLLPPH